MKNTKIIATITEFYDEQKIKDIFTAGVNVLRLNFSHASYEGTKPLVETIHRLNREGKTNLSILLDTKGPEVRTGVRETKYMYKKGELFRIFVDQTKMDQESDMLCDYVYLLDDMKVGDCIQIESGLLKVCVREKNSDHLVAEAMGDCEIGSRRHMNFPGVILRLPGLTEKDKADLLFGIENGIHYVAASFIRTAENVVEIRDFLDQNGGKHIQIVSKIENQEGIDNIDLIVKISDAIMIARGDLGIETPIHQLPHLQKIILDTCFLYGKTCIMATELLKSMVSSPFPTRAEVSDVYNSVISRLDCVMLSDETAIGKYPIETVTLMRETVEEAEKHTNNKHKEFDILRDDDSAIMKKYLAKHALLLADEIKAKAILLFTHSGTIAKITAGYKPNHPVFAFTVRDEVFYGMNIFFSIQPMKLEKWEEHTSENQAKAIQILKDGGFVTSGDKIVVIGDKKRGDQSDPLLRIVTI